jgi:predicted nucleic acid-binding protein
MTALVDSNVLIDIATEDPDWAGWSAAAVARAGAEGALVINPLIWAEVSIAFARVEDLEDALPERVFRREALPWDAGFLAGKAFLAYRRRGGARASPLPDFYIGAHAAVCGYRLVTRDRGRYATYFPGLELLAP